MDRHEVVAILNDPLQLEISGYVIDWAKRKSVEPCPIDYGVFVFCSFSIELYTVFLCLRDDFGGSVETVVGRMKQFDDDYGNELKPEIIKILDKYSG